MEASPLVVVAADLADARPAFGLVLCEDHPEPGHQHSPLRDLGVFPLPLASETMFRYSAPGCVMRIMVQTRARDLREAHGKIYAWLQKHHSARPVIRELFRSETFQPFPVP